MLADELRHEGKFYIAMRLFCAPFCLSLLLSKLSLCKLSHYSNQGGEEKEREHLG